MLIKQVTLKQDIGEFFQFLGQYSKNKLSSWGQNFEKAKSWLVALLMTQRGKYQRSFLTTSFFLLVATIYMAGPIIAENNPLVGQNLEDTTINQNSVISVYSLGSAYYATTKISQKPRDGLVNYKIQSGDTLASIANKFDVTVDTIKWANDLDDDIITTGDSLKIPPISGIVHEVESGDSVYSIAKKYNTEAQGIVNFPFNEFSDPETFALVPGQILFVPNGTPEKLKPQVGYQYQATYTAGQAGTGSFIWPTTGYISQYPIWYHMALDIANPSSPPILAADSGNVSYAGCLGWGYGCHIIVDHNNGFQTLYGHLSVIGVSVGQSVGKGSAIGTMGSTGMSTGTHLHFEVRENGAILNPLSFLQ